jgi:sugar-specific transcriptional regulator TrmB
MAVGLAKEAASLYVLLLEAGTETSKNTAFSLARTLQMPRSSVYLNLERLIANKLVSSYKINNVTHFLAEHPNRIQSDLVEKQNIIKDLLPDLDDLRRMSGTHSAVRTYTGEEGVKRVFDEMFDNRELKNVKQFLTISNTKLSDVLPRGLPAKLDVLKKKYNIYTKMILAPTDPSELENVYKDDSNRETRMLPKDYVFEGSMYIYNDKVAFFALSNNEIYSVIIESKTIVTMIRNFFMCTWDLLAK